MWCIKSISALQIEIWTLFYVEIFIQIFTKINGEMAHKKKKQ